MSDYKELIARLRDLKKATVGGWEIQSLQTEMRMDALDAADAIEQLVRERDAAIDDLVNVCTLYNVANICNTCKRSNFEDCGNMCEYEWRGVEE